jgi:hypothetical protein
MVSVSVLQAESGPPKSIVEYQGAPELRVELIFFDLPAVDAILAVALVMIPAVAGWLSYKNRLAAGILVTLVLFQFASLWTIVVTQQIAGGPLSGPFELKMDLGHLLIFVGAFAAGLIARRIVRKIRRKPDAVESDYLGIAG